MNNLDDDIQPDLEKSDIAIKDKPKADELLSRVGWVI